MELMLIQKHDLFPNLSFMAFFNFQKNRHSFESAEQISKNIIILLNLPKAVQPLRNSDGFLIV